MQKLDQLKPLVRMAIVNPKSQENAMFSRGIALLCQGVLDTGSLNAAAKNMSMAYSKAWRIIRESEESLGVQLLVRNGAHGSTLTEECQTLLRLYNALESFTQQQAEDFYRNEIN